ncbi:MAG TPA: aminoglycoside phosphotransferase family protein [Burkholderiales bacterium]|nr:aminoglycoside phosphotransferase family protein [Burkholderiales bacterium]
MQRFLTESGLGAAVSATPLAGGISSDIWRVELARGPVCVKRALPRLRVVQVWEAPVERNAYEHDWLLEAAKAAPGAVPRVLAQGQGAFAMEYLPPERFPVWKAMLRDGNADPAFAAQVGATLARIHAATAGREDLARRFATDALFFALRLEPYLAFTAGRHPRLRDRLLHLLKVTASTKQCLVHGDVSPKNILAGPRGPVFLDAECAWYGDPAFDLAFCLNHLLLKCLWNRAAASGFLACFDALSGACLEPGNDALEARTAALLPGLLLARIDGKSPVEYVTGENEKEMARGVAAELLLHPRTALKDIRDLWRRSLP